MYIGILPNIQLCHFFKDVFISYLVNCIEKLSSSCHNVKMKGCPRGVMVKAMDCEIVVSEFKLKSRYYVHFQINTHGERMNPLIIPAMG